MHLRLLVDQFAHNPPLAGKAMRDMVESDGSTFTQQALGLLKTVPAGPGSNYILALLLRDASFLSKLSDPDLFSLPEATEIAKRVQKLDPSFDVRIVKQIASAASNADQLEAATAERLLELMSAFSDLSRILPVLAELLKHPSPRIRSKAVLLIGRASANAKLAESHLRETDKRVRANAIEALWGNPSNEARSILSAAATDTNNRVAANAAIGLYKLDETYSIAIILDMAENPSPIFRVSAVWAMSETQDPRFLGTLAKLIGDADPRVRHLAFNAVARIRKNKASLLNGPKLKIFLTEVECSMETQRKLRVSVCSEEGKPAARIVGLQFALEENKRLVPKYSVQELAQTEILAVGIAIPRSLDQAGEFLQSCEASIRSALQQKRSQDQWGILKYACGRSGAATPETQDTIVRFSSDPRTLAEAVAAPGSKDAAALNLTDAAQRLFAEIAPKKAQRHILLIDPPAAGPSSLSQPDADNLLALARQGKIQVYGLVLTGLDSDVNPNVRALCESSGGRIVRIGAVDEIPRALEVLFCTLPSSYEITYVSNSATPASRLSLQVYSPQGCGEQSCEMGNVRKESSIECPTLPESPAHSLAPDPAQCS
ncbi:MAG TPA: HEAT repeat domain-containing protein [Bryobacteraceae bacterium]